MAHLRFWLLGMLWFSWHIGKAQVEENQRLEIPLSDFVDQHFDVYPLNTDGVLLVNSRADLFGRYSSLQFTKMDTVFRMIWNRSFTPPEDFSFQRAWKNDQSLWQIYRKIDSQDLLFLQLNLKTGDLVFTEAKLLTRMDIDFFRVLGNKAIISGMYNDRPVVEMVHLFDKNAKVLPDLYANHLRVNAIEVDELDQLVHILVRDERKCLFYLKSYDYEGKQVINRVISQSRKVPITGKLLYLPDNRRVIVGNFAESCSNYSVGFYIHDIIQNKTQFTDFTELSNFFSYLPEKRQQRVKARLESRQSRGVEVKIRHRILVHDILKKGDEWVLVAEIYYPEYKTPTTLNGSMVQVYRVGREYFNNFKYSHTILCGFNGDGQLVWNNSFAMNNIESNELSKKVQVTTTQDEELLVAYPKDRIIRMMKLEQDYSFLDLEVSQHQQKTNKGRIVDEYQLDLTSWYTNNFLTHGTVSIRNLQTMATRSYFYLNRLTYRSSPSATQALVPN